MTKYNQLFKQQVVNFYFEHHENLAFTLKHFNLAAKTVRCWIAQYKYSGTHGLVVLHRKRLYSPEFKHSVVQTILSGRFTMENVALYFFISVIYFLQRTKANQKTSNKNGENYDKTNLRRVNWCRH